MSVVCVVSITACAGEGEASTNAWQAGQAPVEEEKPELGAPALPEGLLTQVIGQGVPRVVAEAAFMKYEEFRGAIENPRYISMIDFDRHSSENRLWMVDVSTGQVDALPIAHGAGSDPDNDGYADRFSNVPNSRKSSLGAYLIAERYIGKYGQSLRLDGLESSNDLARPRAIVLHPARYVEEGNSKQGRSWGCPAVPFGWIQRVIDRLRDKSFMYAFASLNRTSWQEDRLTMKGMLENPAAWLGEASQAPVEGE